MIDPVAIVAKGPGTRLAVTHRTTFLYATPVTQSQNAVRLEPRTFPYQKTISAFIKVLPATRLRRFTDLFQNITHHFELPAPHDRLEIESLLKVHNLPLDLPAGVLAADLGEYTDISIREQVWTFLQESRWVSYHPEVWRQAVDVTDGVASIHAKTTAIMRWIHDEFTYESGVTSVNTHPEEVFAIRRGVCQDFTHVMIAMCRSIGIAARYASGYLYNGPRDHLLGSQASHAWCEVFLPGGGWIGYDPTNATMADDRYVKVAIGRDYDDVAPVVGSYVGSSQVRMEVAVSVEKL